MDLKWNVSGSDGLWSLQKTLIKVFCGYQSNNGSMIDEIVKPAKKEFFFAAHNLTLLI